MSVRVMDGLRYVTAFVSATEAAALVGSIDAQPWRDDLKRRVQHCGYRYDYRARRVSRADYLGPLPGWLEGLAAPLVADGVFRQSPDQAIVNAYQPGQGIAAHVDCDLCFGEEIASLRLASACEMDFRRVGFDGRRSLALEPNSLMVLSGPARWHWTHGIAARKSDLVDGERVERGRHLSLTFRTLVLWVTVAPP